MKILLAYGSALSRVDDMKLFGGLSGGRTGREILDSVRWNLSAPLNWGENPDPPRVLPDKTEVRILTNPWIPRKPDHAMKNAEWFAFRTWNEYQELLYSACDEWGPDIVICAPAVSNFTPSWGALGVGETTSPVPGPSPTLFQGSYRGKIDTRTHKSMLVHFVQTPNIISGVRERIGRRPVLVGFKLTSHGDGTALVKHARHVLHKAKCDLVIANDLKLGLGRKFFVTQTGWWEGEARDILPVAWDILKAHISGFYTSLKGYTPAIESTNKHRYKVARELSDRLQAHWEEGVEGPGGGHLQHGCFAVRDRQGPGFLTTRRGKEKGSGNDPVTLVHEVDHEKRHVLIGHLKVTLNAPLLAKMFEEHPEVQVVVHLHRFIKDVPTLPYVPPGSFMETVYASKDLGGLEHGWHGSGDKPRTLVFPRAFNIQGHGSIASFTTTDVDTIMEWIEDPGTWGSPCPYCLKGKRMDVATGDYDCPWCKGKGWL